MKKGEEKKDAPKMREIIIKTDGTNIHLVKAEVGGRIELLAILENIIGFLKTPKTPKTTTESVSESKKDKQA